jgi:hypothetical protein
MHLTTSTQHVRFSLIKNVSEVNSSSNIHLLCTFHVNTLIECMQLHRWNVIFNLKCLLFFASRWTNKFVKSELLLMHIFTWCSFSTPFFLLSSIYAFLSSVSLIFAIFFSYPIYLLNQLNLKCFLSLSPQTHTHFSYAIVCRNIISSWT